VASNQATIPAQPFFENQFAGLAKLHGTASATAYIVSANGANFTQGQLGTMFQNFASYRRAIGLTPLSNDQAGIEFMRTYIGESNSCAPTSANRTTAAESSRWRSAPGI
jgi:hypothetical protein